MDTYLIIDSLLRYDLTELMQSLIDYADWIDNYYQTKFNNNLIRYWQSKNVTVKSVLITDLLDWLCCLAFSDGFIAPNEVEFINTYLKQNFTADDIIDICKFRINQEYFDHLPLSFILFYENDLIMKNSNTRFDFNSVERLYNLFMIIGVHFIHCDDKAEVEEWDMLNKYIKDLSRRIHDFNFIHEQQAILETSGEDEYLNDKYPFNQDVYAEYHEELNDLDNLEDIKNEIQNNDSSLDIKFTPWKTKHNDTQNNLWESRNIKTNYSWNLEKNINAYYDFTGEFDNHLVNIWDIVTDKNREIFEIFYLTPQQYQSILNKIRLCRNPHFY